MILKRAATVIILKIIYNIKREWLKDGDTT